LYFSELSDVEHAYHQGQVHLHSTVWVRWGGDLEGPDDLPLEIRVEADGTSWHIYSYSQLRYDDEGDLITQFIQTTPGRIIFNQLIHRFIQWSLSDSEIDNLESRIPETVLPPAVAEYLRKLYARQSIGPRPASLGMVSSGSPSKGLACAWPALTSSDLAKIENYFDTVGHW
jgi:hypothetical protein